MARLDSDLVAVAARVARAGGQRRRAPGAEGNELKHFADERNQESTRAAKNICQLTHVS